MRLAQLCEMITCRVEIPDKWYHVTTELNWDAIREAGRLASIVQVATNRNDLHSPKKGIVRNWLSSDYNQYGNFGNVVLEVTLERTPKTGLLIVTFPRKWTQHMADKLARGKLINITCEFPIPLSRIKRIKWSMPDDSLLVTGPAPTIRV